MEPVSDGPDDGIDLDLAAPGARIGARVVDLLIGFATFFTTLVIVVAAYDVDLSTDQDQIDIPDGGQLILRWAPIIVWAVYEILLTSRRGQTLGKAVAKIKVVAVDGSLQIAPRAASLRWGVLALPPILIPDLLIGLVISFVVGLWFLFDPFRQGLHDKAGGTYVVRVRPPGDAARGL